MNKTSSADSQKNNKIIDDLVKLWNTRKKLFVAILDPLLLYTIFVQNDQQSKSQKVTYSRKYSLWNEIVEGFLSKVNGVNLTFDDLVKMRRRCKAHFDKYNQYLKPFNELFKPEQGGLSSIVIKSEKWLDTVNPVIKISDLNGIRINSGTIYKLNKMYDVDQDLEEVYGDRELMKLLNVNMRSALSIDQLLFTPKIGVYEWMSVNTFEDNVSWVEGLLPYLKTVLYDGLLMSSITVGSDTDDVLFRVQLDLESTYKLPESQMFNEGQLAQTMYEHLQTGVDRKVYCQSITADLSLGGEANKWILNEIGYYDNGQDHGSKIVKKERNPKARIFSVGYDGLKNMNSNNSYVFNEYKMKHELMLYIIWNLIGFTSETLYFWDLLEINIRVLGVTFRREDLSLKTMVDKFADSLGERQKIKTVYFVANKGSWKSSTISKIKDSVLNPRTFVIDSDDYGIFISWVLDQYHVTFDQLLELDLGVKIIGILAAKFYSDYESNIIKYESYINSYIKTKIEQKLLRVTDLKSSYYTYARLRMFSFDLSKLVDELIIDEEIDELFLKLLSHKSISYKIFQQAVIDNCLTQEKDILIHFFHVETEAYRGVVPEIMLPFTNVVDQTITILKRGYTKRMSEIDILTDLALYRLYLLMDSKFSVIYARSEVDVVLNKIMALL